MKNVWSETLHRCQPKALGLAVAMALVAAPALAQDASVYVSSFTYTTSTGEELVWSDPYQTLVAEARNGGGLFGSDSDTYETAGYFPAIGSATTSLTQATYAASGDQGFYLTADATRGSYPVGTPRNESFATASNSGSFLLEAGGSVTFTVGYTLGVDKPGGNAASDFGASFLNFNAMSDNGLSGGMLGDQLFSFAQASGMGSRSGSFVVTVALLANQLGFYTLDGRAEAIAVAVIPEPETYALMLAGLAALGVVRRKRQPVEA